MLWGVGAVLAVGAVIHSNHSRYSRYSQYSDASIVLEIDEKKRQLEKEQIRLQIQKAIYQEEMYEQKKALALKYNMNEEFPSETLSRLAIAKLEEKIEQELRSDKEKIAEIDAVIDKILSVQLNKK